MNEPSNAQSQPKRLVMRMGVRIGAGLVLILAGLTMFTNCGAPISGDVAGATPTGTGASISEASAAATAAATAAASAAATAQAAASGTSTSKASKLVVSPVAMQILPTSGASVTITASGGQPPYQFTILQGAGTLKNTTATQTTYTSGGTMGGVLVVTLDSLGQAATTTIAVTF